MLKRTALFDEHVRLGGRMVDFGGWELPVQYPRGVIEEHLACRSSAGLFDVSHMGEFDVSGPRAAAFLDFLVTNAPSRLTSGGAQYTAMCREDGGIVDDLVIYRRATDRFLVVVNASNTDKDFAHARDVLAAFGAQGVALVNESAKFSQLAVQGRNALRLVEKIAGQPLADVRTYGFTEGKLLGSIEAVIARTGYTGEDGFELYFAWDEGPRVWRALLELGGIEPVGLGARDTLRTEMKYALYGHELTDAINPIEAGLGWIVKMDKPGGFVGQAAIARIQAEGARRKLVGLRMEGRGIARAGYPVVSGGERVGIAGSARVGVVTSGTTAPSLDKQAIAIAYVPPALAAVGTRLGVEIRGAAVEAVVVPTPFYKRNY